MESVEAGVRLPEQTREVNPGRDRRRRRRRYRGGPDSPAAAARLSCSVGIMAFNEAQNIGGLLERLLNQSMHVGEIAEIIVLASGCTDDTENIVRDFCRRNPSIKLLQQPVREGKASAVNMFLRHARNDLLVLESADTLPNPDTIERLIAPFADPSVGMTGGRPVPVNDRQTFMGFAAHLEWEMHHQIALRHPKMGELIAFRRVFRQIPHDTAVDEANMEPLVRGQGFQLKYLPDAVVLTRGPETLADFLKQRRRIYAGHLRIQHQHGYAVSTMNAPRLITALARSLGWNWRFVCWTPVVMLMELAARTLGWFDFHFGDPGRHTVWDIAATTKGSIK
jgi:biofilm PGA synthesis N-glycosyltransferase PgaC